MVMKTLNHSYQMAFFDGYVPSLNLIEMNSNLLVSGGLLVCANMALLSDSERNLISKQLADKSKWLHPSAIEQGKTLLLEKV